MTLAEGIQIATLASVFLGMLISWKNGKKADVIHFAINSRMDQLLTETRKSSHAEGVAEGAAKEK